MNIRRLEVSSDLPIKIQDAKLALRIDHGFEDDTLTRKLRAAVELVEERTTRILRPTTFEASFPSWPCASSEFCLPVAPLRSVEAVSYYPQAGTVREEVAPALFDWRRVEGGGEVYFYSAFPGPSVSEDRRDPISIKFEAGYDVPSAQAGDDPELTIPDRVVELVLLVAGHWMKYREAVTSGDLVEVPLSADLLFKELRIFR